MDKIEIFGKTKSLDEFTDDAIRIGSEAINNRIISVTNDKDFNKHIETVRRAQETNKGWSGGKTRRWIARIPLDVWHGAIRAFGEEALKKDKKLFKKVFKPWLLVSPKGI